MGIYLHCVSTTSRSKRKFLIKFSKWEDCKGTKHNWNWAYWDLMKLYCRKLIIIFDFTLNSWIREKFRCLLYRSWYCIRILYSRHQKWLNFWQPFIIYALISVHLFWVFHYAWSAFIVMKLFDETNAVDWSFSSIIW